jgi:quercetin dioxygenase-like cupin family protein
MPLLTYPIPLADWRPLPFDGCRNVAGKVLLRLPHLTIALLHFQAGATIHEHSAAIDIDVICLEGSGITSVGEESAFLQSGQQIRWPAGISHRLWTEDSEMLTMMVEHTPPIPLAEQPG